MLLAASVLSWMIIWMNRQAKNIRTEFHEKIDHAVTNQHKIGIILLVFFSVAREGAELVLFLYANYLGNLENFDPLISLFINLTGFLLGVIVASVIAFILFRTTKQLDVKKFFQVTSIILVFFAAGLFAHAFHEIYEFLELSGSSLANIFIWAELWNINDTILGDILNILFGWSYDPTYSARFEKSAVGGIFVGLFGWNDNPALIEVVVYGVYLFVVFLVLRKANAKINLEDNEIPNNIS
jgi:high-affinity iron transporter